MGAAITVADLLFNCSRGVGGFGYSLIERLLIAARAFWFYVGKLFWPLDLAGHLPALGGARGCPAGLGRLRR